MKSIYAIILVFISLLATSNLAQAAIREGYFFFNNNSNRTYHLKYETTKHGIWVKQPKVIHPGDNVYAKGESNAFIITGFEGTVFLLNDKNKVICNYSVVSPFFGLPSTYAHCIPGVPVDNSQSATNNRYAVVAVIN